MSALKGIWNFYIFRVVGRQPGLHLTPIRRLKSQVRGCPPGLLEDVTAERGEFNRSRLPPNGCNDSQDNQGGGDSKGRTPHSKRGMRCQRFESKQFIAEVARDGNGLDFRCDLSIECLLFSEPFLQAGVTLGERESLGDLGIIPLPPSRPAFLQ